jgi:hypothetical protein
MVGARADHFGRRQAVLTSEHLGSPASIANTVGIFAVRKWASITMYAASLEQKIETSLSRVLGQPCNKEL